jgi:hypothetical protein
MPRTRTKPIIMIKLEEIRAQQTIQELYYKTKSGVFTFSSSKTRKIMIKKNPGH